MLFGKISNLSSSVSVRLTFWSILIFSACLICVLSAFYYIAEHFILRAIDSSIIYELEEAQSLYKRKGFDPLPAHIIEEAEEYDSSKSFFRIIDKSGKVVATSDLSDWGSLPAPQAIQSTNTRKENLRINLENNSEDFIRVVSVALSDDLFIEGGLKSNHEIQLLNLYKHALPITGLIIIILTATTVYLTARSAMNRVDQMTALATSISASQLDARLPEWPYDDELSRLSATFNKLLSRIETLVKGMKHVTDDIAHDLKMPITRMRSRAELSLSSNNRTEETFIDEAANTLEECDHLLNMLNSMLDISEAEAKLVRLQIEVLDLDNLLRMAVDLFEPVAEQKSISVSYFSSDKMNIEGDISKLQRAFSNLIDNAIKYTPEHGRIKVSLKTDEKDAIVEISDTGIGIASEELPLIFERFYRADISRSGTGSGLGLTMSKALIEAHGGTILVQSALGKGTTFSIRLKQKLDCSSFQN